MLNEVKLFENWAKENIKLPVWLDPKRKQVGRGASYSYTVYAQTIFDSITNNDILYLDNVNFKSFSDYDFWKDNYVSIKVYQYGLPYRLEDCFGIPTSKSLTLSKNNIKSLKGLENLRFEHISIQECFLENLKYCPVSIELGFQYTPLLSYYGITSNSIQSFIHNLCGTKCYKKAGYDYDNIPTLEQLNDPEFNAEIFSFFDFFLPKEETRNPWTQVYEDPNEVENYDFLFVPFYLNSENFRTKAKEYIKNLDITNLDRSNLW